MRIKTLEKKGLRIFRNKTEYIEYKFEKQTQVDDARNEMIIDGDEIKEVEYYKYSETFIQKKCVLTRMRRKH